MPRPQRHTETDNVERPPIWVAGQQQPKFAFLAWIRVGQAMTRRWLAPRLTRASAWLLTVSEQIEAGRFTLLPGWLGRAQHYFPTRTAIGGAVAGVSDRMAEARLLLLPALAQPQAPDYPDLIGAPAARVTASVGPRRHLSDTDPAVQAIRAMINAEAEPPFTQPAPVTSPKTAPTMRFSPIEPPEPALPTLAMRLGAHAIAWSSLALILPVGLVQATIYHLNGGDLADWE